MKKKHIISPPSSGKTTEILSIAGPRDIIIVRRQMQSLYAPVNPAKKKAQAQLLIVESDLRGVFLAAQRIFIDDLLSYNKSEVEWLWDVLHERLDNSPEVIAYSSPVRKYRRELMMLSAVVPIIFEVGNIKCPPLYGDDRKKIQNDLLELQKYLLSADVEIGFRRNTSFINDLEGLERNMGSELFDIKFNLNIVE